MTSSISLQHVLWLSWVVHPQITLRQVLACVSHLETCVSGPHPPILCGCVMIVMIAIYVWVQEGSLEPGSEGSVLERVLAKPEDTPGCDSIV